MLNTPERSTVLLLCLGLDTDKTEVKKVNVAELRDIFGKYGQLQKVIIFTRKILLKAFLEYATYEQAEAAKSAIHETQVKHYGKARLYFSPMQELKFSNKYLEYWEESNNEKPLSMDDDVSTKLSFKHSTSTSSNRLMFRKESCPFVPQQRNLAPRSYQLFSSSIDALDTNLNNDTFLSNKNFVFNSSLGLYNSICDDSKPTQLSELETSPELSKSNSVDDEVNVPSKVVLVSNLAHVFRSTDEIFNLFSAFGNVSKILFMMNLQKALIEYADIDAATHTMNNLNNLALGETKLRVSISKYKKIDLLKNNKNENSMQYNQVLIVPPVRNRYKSNSHSEIVPLSSTLLISFPKNSGAQTIDVYLAIQKICKPVKTKLVSNKGQASESEVVNMLFSFSDEQSAVYVMYKCHSSIVKGAQLDIFFF